MYLNHMHLFMETNIMTKIYKILSVTVYFQNAAFTLPSNFDWLHNYTTSKQDDSNPSVLDMFDPLTASVKMNG
jgi:hypothetical protein